MSSTGVLIRPHFDTNGKDLAIEHVQDVEPILERNKALRSEPQKSDWGRWVASIPNINIVQWMNEEMERGHYVLPFTKEFDEVVARKLKDPEWAYLRVDNPSNPFHLGWRP